MSSQPFDPSLYRLLQVVSPSLPVGSYSYSQGLEWVVHSGWVTDAQECSVWLTEQLNGVLQQQELPLLIRSYEAADKSDFEALAYWDAMSLAMRETSELRREEQQRGLALAAVLQSLQLEPPVRIQSYVSAFAYFCVSEKIPLPDALAGFSYSWLESQVTAAIKLVPLGQSEGQAMLYRLSSGLTATVDAALQVSDENMGYTAPALAMASTLHETQYSRSYRS